MLKRRTTNAALGFFLSATLCASLVPLKGIEAYAAESANESPGVADSASMGFGEGEQGAQDVITDDSADEVYWAASGEDTIVVADSAGESTEVVETLSEDVRETLETTGAATIVRDGESVVYDSINEAVGSALDGEAVLVEGVHVLTEPIRVAGGKSISLIGKGQAKVVRGEGYPHPDGKPDALVLLSERSSLTIEAEGSEGLLSFDGEAKDSNKAIIVVDGASQLVMGAGSQVENASASWKPWGGVHVRSGSFVLDGGRIANGFA